MLVKIHKSYRDVIAICDKELLGKYFEEGKFQLDIKESFFGGENKSKQETIDLMKDMSREDATFYIVGKNSIECAIVAGIITKESVGEIDNIPFALVLL